MKSPMGVNGRLGSSIAIKCTFVKYLFPTPACYTRRMAELKTKPTQASVLDFITSVAEEQQRKDSKVLLQLFKKVTKEKPKMWGTSIVGFGMYHYKSERSSQEGDWPLVGFSPRKQNLTLYLMPGFAGLEDLLKKLGKHKTSKACLYIKKLTDVNMDVLEKVVQKSFGAAKKQFKVK